MFWIFLILVAGFIVIKFFISVQEDENDLQGESVNEKFSTVVSILNSAVFQGRAKVDRTDKRSFNLYDGSSNTIIFFHYSTGILTITWRYKYFQKEVVHKKDFSNVRNISIFDQQKIADIMMGEMRVIVEKHKRDVLDS